MFFGKKHPEAHAPYARSLGAYLVSPPKLVPLELTEDTVAEVARSLSGGAETGGTESVSLHHYIIRFREAIKDLRMIVAKFAEWLENLRPPWYS